MTVGELIAALDKTKYSAEVVVWSDEYGSQTFTVDVFTDSNGYQVVALNVDCE